MSWGECKAGAGKFINLKNDGDKVVVTILGEPVVKSSTDKKGLTRKRVFVNAATAIDIEKGESCSILACNITTAESLAKGLKVGEGFKPAESLVGKVAVSIVRKGAASDIGTKYLVGIEGKLSPAEAKKVAKLELCNLDEVEFTSKN